MNYLEKYIEWCEEPYFDEETKKELIPLSEEIKDRFYKDLEFGTGGLRGILGAGTNRMNLYTVRKATQGLADYIISRCGQDRGVAISFDSRHMSEEFSREVASCLNANGIKTYRFSTLRPTPELSYGVRKLGCIAGIMITASHNPAWYNGYKVYWEDGCQITASHDQEIMEAIQNVKNPSDCRTMSEAEAVSLGLYHELGEEMDDAYLSEIQNLVLHPQVVKEMSDLSIVYTPLHGTGLVPVTRLLERMGFRNVHVVEEQACPNGDFPTVASPNPEDLRAFDMALSLAELTDADIVLATDPDADRLGVYVKDETKKSYNALNGNMTGILLCDYILSQRKMLGTLPEHGAIIKTIVTTNMVYPLAKEYGVKVEEVLTGFKYIGEKIREFEEMESYEFLFGFEESYGCLIGTYARDKDGVSAAAMLCEAAAWYKKQGISLWTRLLQLYEKYGCYQERLDMETRKGETGSLQIQGLMKEMREHLPEYIDGKKVLKVRDYLTGVVLDLESGEKTETGLPVSDVLYFELEQGGWYCMRPSGTEPKIKYYREYIEK
ncbi:MAG TPA: phosphoglucomutase [Lachnoclostridium sp.]|nr:phosphoglucomutase [Lachnoclostridium sp.]